MVSERIRVVVGRGLLQVWWWQGVYGSERLSAVSRRRGRQRWRLGHFVQRTKAAIIFFTVSGLSSFDLRNLPTPHSKVSVMMSNKDS